MAPGVSLTIWATPALPLPAVALGQATVSPASRVNSAGAAAFRYFEKFEVVPEPSERTATVMAVLGRVTPELSAAMAGSFQVVMVPMKILARVSGESLSSSTPLRLYDTVMGAATVGK